MDDADKRPELVAVDSSETVSSDDYYDDGHPTPSAEGMYMVESMQRVRMTEAPREGNMEPTMSSSANYGWSQNMLGSARHRNGSNGAIGPNAELPESSQITSNGTQSSQRSSRPTVARHQSNLYNPARRPQQYSTSSSGRQRTGSTTRSRKLANQEYRAQEKAYVQRIRQDNTDNDFDKRMPDLDYSEASDTDSDNAAVGDYVEDPYDQETLLYYGNEDMQPSVEELKIPENRERLEWHSMLASVLTGDVVKQEKKRLIGGSDQQGGSTRKAEVWMGIRAKVCGRTIAAQRRMIEDGRAQVKTMVEEIITFEIKGEAEVGKSAVEQVEDIRKKIEKVEGLYPSRTVFEAADPRAASPAYADACNAVMSWHNTTELINTELAILQRWVGNEELDFSRARPRSDGESDDRLFDDSSFIDRILKEDGLKSLSKDSSLLTGVNNVISKAKSTLISNAEGFADRHLPPYIEELLTLINFPSRLIQEVIKTRLNYAKNMKDAAQQSAMMAEQMLIQFHLLLESAVDIKKAYTLTAQPEPGWDLPPCIDESFDSGILEALRFYFKSLSWYLTSPKNTYKEAEILEAEWAFSNGIGRYFEGGDVEVAEQFRYVKSNERRLFLYLMAMKYIVH